MKQYLIKGRYILLFIALYLNNQYLLEHTPVKYVINIFQTYSGLTTFERMFSIYAGIVLLFYSFTLKTINSEMIIRYKTNGLRKLLVTRAFKESFCFVSILYSTQILYAILKLDVGTILESGIIYYISMYVVAYSFIYISIIFMYTLIYFLIRNMPLALFITLIPQFLIVYKGASILRENIMIFEQVYTMHSFVIFNYLRILAALLIFAYVSYLLFTYILEKHDFIYEEEL